MNGRILIVDDDASMGEMLETDLRRRGLETVWCDRAEDALERFGEREFDIILTDLNLPGMSGIDLCVRTAADRPDVPVVVLTGFGSMDTAIAAIRAGAYDFVTKPIDPDLLVIVLERALKHRALQEQVKILEQSATRELLGGDLIGQSPPMRKLISQIGRIAETDASVLIRGESGTGKELVARILHRHSPRSAAAFVALNCAALPETLLESELFGYKKGSFTDAKADKPGLLQEASGGTLFLDEIGEMSLALQPKVLRALEERCYRPLGARREVGFDVRIISASNRDLESAVADGRFREDLYYRLNVIQLTAPPLRSRGTDILLLARHFLEEFAGRSGKAVLGLSETTMDKLLNYAWPGNVRELRNAMERAVALARHDKVLVEDLPERIRDYHPSHLILGSSDPQDLVPMEEVERRYIQHVLDAAGGNRTLAARILGFDRKTLYRKLRRYGKREP
jgi:two-component system response regulator HydG